MTHKYYQIYRIKIMFINRNKVFQKNNTLLKCDLKVSYPKLSL